MFEVAIQFAQMNVPPGSLECHHVSSNLEFLNKNPLLDDQIELSEKYISLENGVILLMVQKSG